MNNRNMTRNNNNDIKGNRSKNFITLNECCVNIYVYAFGMHFTAKSVNR